MTSMRRLIPLAATCVFSFMVAFTVCYPAQTLTDTNLYEESSPCFLCEIAVEALRYLYEKKTTEDMILKVAIHICEHYADNETLICEGLISQFQDSFLYVLEELTLKPSQLCGLFLSDCGKFHNPFDSNWTIALPERPANEDKKSPRLAPYLTPIFQRDANSKKNQLQVLQLSDLHYDPIYEPGSEADCSQPICCQRNSSTTSDRNGSVPLQPAGYWGSVAKCDLPYRTILNMLQNIRKTHQIDYIMLTGDLTSHSDWTYTRLDHSKVIRTVNASLNTFLPNVPAFWAVGNHEGVPVNAFAPHFAPERFRPDWLYHEIASAAQKWMPKQQLPQALYRGSYIVMLTDSLKLISLNSGYCELTNFFLYINQTDPDGTLSWLVDELYGCEVAGWHAHIISHIPPGDSECIEGWARNYYRIVNRFSETIKAQFFGHVHKDSFTVFYEQMNDDKSTPTGVLYATPSVTSFSRLNPAYRIYTIDTNSNEVLDFTTYFFNISAAENSPRWEPLYSAREEYGLSDLSPASWNELAQRIYSNRTTFQRFLKNYARSANYKCDENCRVELLCSLTRGHHDNNNAKCTNVMLLKHHSVESRLRHNFVKLPIENDEATLREFSLARDHVMRRRAMMRSTENKSKEKDEKRRHSKAGLRGTTKSSRNNETF